MSNVSSVVLLRPEIVVDLVMLVEVESMMDVADTALVVGVLIEFEIILALLDVTCMILPIQEHKANQLAYIRSYVYTYSMSISAIIQRKLINTRASYLSVLQWLY